MKRRTVRRLAWVGVALCAVALALGVTERLVWRPGVTPANVRRVRVGMTLDEVEALMGCPAHLAFDLDREGVPIGDRRYRWLRNWTAEDAGVNAEFDEAGRVQAVNAVVWREPSAFESLRSLLGW
jgi:hypothetical protein